MYSRAINYSVLNSSYFVDKNRWVRIWTKLSFFVISNRKYKFIFVVWNSEFMKRNDIWVEQLTENKAFNFYHRRFNWGLESKHNKKNRSKAKISQNMLIFNDSRVLCRELFLIFILSNYIIKIKFKDASGLWNDVGRFRLQLFITGWFLWLFFWI